MEIQIIEVSGNDLNMLQEISRRTFFQAFAGVNTPGNMQFFLDHHYSKEKLSEELLNPDSQFYFATLDHEPVGYLKLNQRNAQTVLPNDQGLEIERIYMDSDSKGMGIGKLFIRKTIEFAHASRVKFIWLGVWEHNTSAIHFYEKNGFEIYGSHIFKLGDDDQTDLLMRRMIF